MLYKLIFILWNSQDQLPVDWQNMKLALNCEKIAKIKIKQQN